MKNIKSLLRGIFQISITTVISIRYSYGIVLVILFAFFISCQVDSNAQKNNSKIYLDSIPMTHPGAIGQIGHEVYSYNSYQNPEGVLIKKLKINIKDRSAKVVDSLKIGNAYLRYIGADEQNHIYISCLPIQKEHPLLIQNKEYQFGSADSGLRLVYILDANNFNVVDSIIYTGNDMQLTTGDLPGGIITTTSYGVCLLNRLSYSPRFNKLDNRKLEGNALYFLFYKSVDGSVLLPISKDLLNDFNDLPARMKHYVNQVGGFKTSNIYIIGDDIHRIYFTLNLSVTVDNKDSIQEKNGGAHHFCQLFSIDKKSGHIKKYLTFQYRQPRTITHTKEGIFYAHAFNFQQLRVEKDFLLFSISAISKCDELNIEDDTISTAIVKIDPSTFNLKIVNITYRPNQLINLYDLTLNDLEHKDIINSKSLFPGFDYLSWQAGPVYLNKDYTFIEKRQTWGNSILFFK